MPSCHICNSESTRQFLVVGQYTLIECKSCSHIQVFPIPSEADLLVLYQNVTDDSFFGNGCSVQMLDKYATDKTFLMRFYSERLDVMSKYGIAKGAAMLDYGCTNGAFVRAMLDAGYPKACGYDIAEDLVAQGKADGLNLFTGDIAQVRRELPEGLDGVISYNVFEHLPYPRKSLAGISGLIKSNGMLIISVPFIHSFQGRLLKDRSCAIVDPPYHIHYYTRRSMSRMLEDCGFTVVSMSTPFWTKMTDVFLVLKGWPRFVAVSLRIAVIPIGWFMNLFHLGGTLLVVARKK